MDTHHSQTKASSNIGLSEREYIYYFKNGRKALRDFYFSAVSIDEAFTKNGLQKPSDADVKWMKEQYIADEKQYLKNLQLSIEKERISVEKYKLDKWILTPENALLIKSQQKTKIEYLKTLWKFEDEQNEN